MLHEVALVFDLSANGAETPENAPRTHLVVGGDKFSIADLLGCGMASTLGRNFVAEALKEIQETRMEVSTLLGLDPAYAAQNPALEQQRKAVTDQLNELFGAGKGDSCAGAFRVDANDDNTPDNAAGARNPGKDEIIEDIDDTSDALSSADAFAAATAQGGKGVFKEAEPSADDAARGGSRGPPDDPCRALDYSVFEERNE